VAAAIGALAALEADIQRTTGEHEHLGRLWITPTVLRAGEPVQMNVMPAKASMWIDVRTVPAIEHAELVDAVSRAVAEASTAHGVTTSVDVIDDRPAVEIDEGDPLVAALWDAHAAVASTAPRLGGVPGATDGTVLTSRGGITSVVYGPGGKWIAHQADEFVEVADLVTHADVYVDAATRFLAAPAV
jgi:succinyl-diaminopimelate desuccinylase